MADRLSWKGVLWSGLIAGIVFMMLQMVLVAVIGGGSLWGPPRMVAAIVLGPSVLPPPGDFALGVMVVAMMVHFVLSFVFAAILGWIISAANLDLWPAIIAGLVFGLVIYFFNFYVMTGVFPWFAKARNLISIFDHAMFGLVLGWVYAAIAPRPMNPATA